MHSKRRWEGPLNTYLQSTRDLIATATHGLSSEQLARRRAEGKWCAAEILEHLARAFKTTVTHLQKCLDSGRPSATPMSFRQRLIVGLVVDLGYFPSGREAPDFTRPRGLPSEEVLRQVQEHLAAMDQVLEECERRFGTRVKLADHPVLGALTVNQWRRFHWVHTRHHMKQIARIRKATDRHG